MSTRTKRWPNSDDFGIVDGLVQLSAIVQRVLSDVAASEDLSLLQGRLLGVLRDHEPTMAQIARILGLDKSSTTGLIDRAEIRGLVERHNVPEDGRAFRVVLTREGRRLASVLGSEVTAQIDELTASMSESELRQLSSMASRVVIDFADRHGIDISTVPVQTPRAPRPR